MKKSKIVSKLVFYAQSTGEEEEEEEEKCRETQ